MPLTYDELVKLDEDIWLWEKNCRLSRRETNPDSRREFWKWVKEAINDLSGPGRIKERTPSTEILYTGEAWEIVFYKFKELMGVRNA